MTRGPLTESVHSVAACALGVDGSELLVEGDVDRPVFLRSAAKPFIAAAIVRSGAAERFGFEAREIAVMSASHAGERFHVDAVRSILQKTGLDVCALQCGAHPPRYEAAAVALAARGEGYSALHNNCSGKHAGILALALALEAPVNSYLDVGHPAQRAILALCERAFGVTFDASNLGIDGCGIPAIALPLRAAALGFARYATLEGLDDADAAALARVRDAVVAWPAYIGGTDSFDSALIAATGGAVVAKGGAEGVHSDALRNVGAGLVVKVADGAKRAVAPAVVALLRSLGALDDAAAEAVAPFERTAIENVAGRTVGHVAVSGVPSLSHESSGPRRQPTESISNA